MLIFFLYLNKNYGFYIPCLFHKLTNLYCPGCGITRCIVSLLKGNISAAFKYNQLVFILLPFLTVYFIYKIYLYLTNSQDKIIKKIPNITDYFTNNNNTIWNIKKYQIFYIFKTIELCKKIHFIIFIIYSIIFKKYRII